MYLDKRRWTFSWWIDSTQGWPRWVTASCRQISIFQHLYIGRQPDNFRNNMGSQISHSNMILMQEQWDTSNVFHFLKLLTWKCRDFPLPGLVGKYQAGPQENPTPTAYPIFCELCLISSFSQLGCSSNSFCHGSQTMSSCAGWQVIVRKKSEDSPLPIQSVGDENSCYRTASYVDDSSPSHHLSSDVTWGDDQTRPDISWI